MAVRFLYDRNRKSAHFPLGPRKTPATPRDARRTRTISGKATHVAKQTTVTLVDDLDGSEADEQIEFAVDGRSYEIDLSSANVARLRDALGPFISAARRSGGRRGSGSSATPRASTDRAQNQAIREWAQAQGMKISERGRIPSNVLEAYHQSH
jgi:hypothetical protein